MTIDINPNRIDLDEAYMQMAEVWAKRSKANRLQVGALLVQGRQIISDGYNGMPAGSPDDVCEDVINGELRTKREVLHAESNCLLKISENGGTGAAGATLYTTWSPCFECSKLIRQAKVKRVVFRNLYRDGAGIEFLRRMGVQVDQLKQVGQTVYNTPIPVEVVQPKSTLQNEPIPVEVVKPIPQPPQFVAQPAVSEAEVEAVLRQHQASLANQAFAQARQPVNKQDDAPYQSSFI